MRAPRSRGASGKLPVSRASSAAGSALRSRASCASRSMRSASFIVAEHINPGANSLLRSAPGVHAPFDRFVEALGPRGSGVRLAGLCDAAEVGYVRRGLERAGLGASLTPADTEALGFFVCDADLEDELIRAAGTAAVVRLLDAQAELASFRSFQKQPAQQGRDDHAQLRRFMGTRSGRKIRYGALLIDALDLDRVPRPLDKVLAHVRG